MQGLNSAAAMTKDVVDEATDLILQARNMRDRLMTELAGCQTRQIEIESQLNALACVNNMLASEAPAVPTPQPMQSRGGR